jgi:hypothetical protein
MSQDESAFESCMRLLRWILNAYFSFNDRLNNITTVTLSLDHTLNNNIERVANQLGMPMNDRFVTNNLQLKVEDDAKEKPCVVCLDNRRKTITMPCTHQTMCVSCANKTTECPICRGDIKQIITYISC